MTFQQNREHDKIRTGGLIISILSRMDGWMVLLLVLWLVDWLFG